MYIDVIFCTACLKFSSRTMIIIERFYFPRIYYHREKIYGESDIFTKYFSFEVTEQVKDKFNTVKKDKLRN